MYTEQVEEEKKNQHIREWNPMISCSKCFGVNICILFPNSYVEALISNVLYLEMGPIKK